MEAEQPGGASLVIAGILVVGALIWVTHNSGFSSPAPGFSLPEAFSGSQVDLTSYRGQKVLLVFWTTSCGICRRELPLLDNLSAELMNKGVSVVAIHLGPEDIRNYLRTNNVNLLSLLDTDGAVGQAYHVTGVPKLVLIGEDGKIRRSHAGMADEDMLREWGGAN